MKDLPSRWFYLALLVWLAAVVALAVFTDVRIGTYALVTGMVALAVLRIFGSERVVPHVRATWFDVASLLAAAAVLTYLAPWGLSAAF